MSRLFRYLFCLLALICLPFVALAQDSAQGSSSSQSAKSSDEMFEGKILFVNTNNYSVTVSAGGYSSTLYLGRGSGLSSNKKPIAFDDLNIGQKVLMSPGTNIGGQLKLSSLEVTEPVIHRKSPVPSPKSSEVSGTVEKYDPFNKRLTVSSKGRMYYVDLPEGVKWTGSGKKGVRSLVKGKSVKVKLEHFGVSRQEAVFIEMQ